jgi:alkylation response protein AidB-like acyl-CoA dehydrogenase
MNFAFSEDQDMIRKSAADFVKGQSSIERIRNLLHDPAGYSPELFRQMADSGWLGTVIPEEFGGIGLGYVDLVCIQEELGRGLIPEPLLTSGVLGANCVLHGCVVEQKQELLPQVVSGDLKLTLAAYEVAGRYNLAHVETTARADGDNFILNGSKHFVADAATADRIIVSARTSGAQDDAEGITLFLVDRETAGLTIETVVCVDRRQRANLTLKGAKVPASAVVGREGKGLDALEKAVDRATIALCAEMVGGMEIALQMSVAYSKERVQFGKPIGSFQALKHKAANMYVLSETAKSAVYYAAMALDDGMKEARAAVSTAKALCSDAYVKITKDAIQIHGGIGYTDEADIHLYYKRALAANVTFGDADFHRDRYATERGF